MSFFLAVSTCPAYNGVTLILKLCPALEYLKLAMFLWAPGPLMGVVSGGACAERRMCRHLLRISSSLTLVRS